jgi:hypothetical protein
MENRLIDLERSLRRMKILNATLLTALLALFLLGMRQVNPDNDVLRCKGLVIEDAAGHERILLGAPVPAAKNRVRTDPARVEQVWAKRFGDGKQYMEYYKNYRHDTNGLLILDENGFDRIALGDPTPDPNIGRRIAPATGIEINDEQGFERTGYGLLNVQGVQRVVLGLDSRNGTEGIALVLRDDGQVGLMVHDGKQDLVLGRAPDHELEDDAGQPLLGIVWKKAGEVVRTFSARDE